MVSRIVVPSKFFINHKSYVIIINKTLEIGKRFPVTLNFRLVIVELLLSSCYSTSVFLSRFVFKILKVLTHQHAGSVLIAMSRGALSFTAIPQHAS